MRLIYLGAKAGYSRVERMLNLVQEKMGTKSRYVQGPGKGNAGDTAIVESLYRIFNEEFPDYEVEFMSCRKIFTKKDVRYINEADLLFIGAGGLFLYDTFRNKVSDWQWGISKELLEQIETPIIVYAIGYNRFRGQRDFNDLFRGTVNTLVKKSLFFGLRNTGSIKAVKGYVDEDLRDRIRLNYCPTLLLNEVYGYKNTLDHNNVGFLFAGDRLENRHRDIDAFVGHMERYLKYLKKNKITSVLIRHFDPDDWIREYLDFDDHLDLYKKPSDSIYEAYSDLDLVIGDRGHTQMIAFACGCKILIPVSHDKLRFFMEDMDLMEYSIEEYDDKLSDKLIEGTKRLKKVDWKAVHKDRMRTIADTNKENLRIIHERMKGLERSRANK